MNRKWLTGLAVSGMLITGTVRADDPLTPEQAKQRLEQRISNRGRTK